MNIQFQMKSINAYTSLGYVNQFIIPMVDLRIFEQKGQLGSTLWKGTDVCHHPKLIMVEKVLH